MSTPETKFWFPAKTYGWGWGPPVVWQGWAVVVVYFCAVLLSIFLLGKARGLAVSFLLTLLFVYLCWLKGEKPKWRWGGQ